MNSIEWLERLIAFDTTSKFSNLELIGYVQDWFKRHGITSHIISDPSEHKANLFATIPAVDGSVTGGIVLSGHTDVVPVEGQLWQTNPFELTQKDGKIYGRGTSDMKGFIAVALSLLPDFQKMKLQHPVHFALSYDEEIGCRGAPLMIHEMTRMGVKPAACIVGEPTMMQPVVAHKGIQVYRCRVHGKAAHSSLTTQGCNAIDYAARLICHIREIAEKIKHSGQKDAHFDVPFTTLTTNLIKGGAAYNIIPEFCEFILEIRNLPQENPKQFEEQVEFFIQKELLPKMLREFPEAQVDLIKLASAPAFDSDHQSAFAKSMYKLTGEKDIRKVAYATEAGLFQNANIPSIICGPGSIEQAHKPDEYVEVAQLEKCAGFLRKAVAQ